MNDYRLNKEWKIIKCGRGPENDVELGVATLINKIGPGHFIAVMNGKMFDVYSCQLRKIK